MRNLEFLRVFGAITRLRLMHKKGVNGCILHKKIKCVILKTQKNNRPQGVDLITKIELPPRLLCQSFKGWFFYALKDQ